MPKYKEILEPDYYYHIYNRANGNEKLFLNDDNYSYFLQKYNHYINPIADTFTYCLMPNHFHFLVRIKPISNLTGFGNLSGLDNISKHLSQQFSNFFNAYTKAFNKQNNRKGSLFERPFNRIKITTNEYLLNAINYIHQNPVNHGLAENIDDWKYSSYNVFLSNRPTNINRKEIIELFDDIDNFIFYHKTQSFEKYALEMELAY